MFYDVDLSKFLTDFGKTATLSSGGDVTVIFDDEYVAAVPMTTEIETTKPQAVGLTADLENIVHDSTLEIDGVTYRVIGIHPDGTGMTTLILSKE